MTTDHRAAAAQFYGHSDEVLDDRAKPMGASSAMQRAQFHLLAAIHDGQAEQTEWLHRIRDLLDVSTEGQCEQTDLLQALLAAQESRTAPEAGTDSQDAPEAGREAHSDESCRNCDGLKCMGCVFREYDHDCADDCPDCCTKPDPDTVTVTLPRAVVEVTSAVGWRANADMLRMRNFRVSAGLLNALADALDAANGSQS